MNEEEENKQIVDAIVKSVVREEKKNLKTNEKTDAVMVKWIEKEIKNKVKCYSKN